MHAYKTQSTGRVQVTLVNYLSLYGAHGYSLERQVRYKRGQTNIQEHILTVEYHTAISSQ